MCNSIVQLSSNQEKVADIELNLNELSTFQREVIQGTTTQSDLLMQLQEMVNKQTSNWHKLSINECNQEPIR